jgi:hypothetical protein
MTLHREDHFAELRSCFEVSMRRGGFRERENAIDNRLKAARGD